MERDFKGVWIPKEIWLDERLNALDKIILAEINSLDGEEGCYASNQYLAEFCQCSEAKITKSIALLVKLGYIKVISFDGRKRFLKTCLIKNTRQSSKIYQADLENLPDNNIYNNKDNNIIDKSIILEESNSYGNPRINEMFDKWYEFFGYRPKDSKQNRFAVYNMLRSKDKGEDWLINTMRILREAQKDKFAGKEVNGVADFADLQRNYDKIWKWGSSKIRQKQQTMTTIKI